MGNSEIHYQTLLLEQSDLKEQSDQWFCAICMAVWDDENLGYNFIVYFYRDGSLGKASKAFLTRDVCGQQYLCYVISYRQQLR